MRVARCGLSVLAILLTVTVSLPAQSVDQSQLPLITRTPLTVPSPRARRPQRPATIKQTGLELLGQAEMLSCSKPWLHWAHRFGFPTADDCTPAPADCGSKSFDPAAWGLAIDWLYLTARGNDFPYAYPACDCADEPDGPAGLLDFDYEPAYRWRVSRRIGGLWLDVTGMHFLGETSNAIGADADHELRDLVFLSAAPEASVAAARNELKLMVFDADLRGTLYATHAFELALFGGVRVARVDQNADFFFEESDWGSSSVDVRGAGLRGGLQTTCYYGNCFVWGRSALSLLAAQLEMDYMQHRTGGPATVSEYHISDDRLVPTLDLELGAGYHLGHGWAISAGYLYSIWFNVAGPEDLVAELRSGSYYGNVEDELSWDGFFLRLEYGRFRGTAVGD